MRELEEMEIGKEEEHEPEVSAGMSRLTPNPSTSGILWGICEEAV